MKIALLLALAVSVTTCVSATLVRASSPMKTRARAFDGINRPRAKRKQRPQATRTRRPPIRAAMQVPVSLLDGAGIKQLFARGTPPNERPLLVNFWATWCEPCREEFPDLVKIDSDYRARGLDFVAISVDEPSELKTGVPKFLGAMRARMPAYILNVTDSEPVINSVDPTWGGELPATFLFDRHGQIVFKHKGRIKPEELRPVLDQVLREN